MNPAKPIVEIFTSRRQDAANEMSRDTAAHTKLTLSGLYLFILTNTRQVKNL